MKVKARNYLFIFKKSKVKAKLCNQCTKEFKFGDLIYSKIKSIRNANTYTITGEARS